MKRASGKKSARIKTPPTADQLQNFIHAMRVEHEVEFTEELHSRAPHWEYLLALHLRLSELEHLVPAVGDLS
jgi:hypothetical protein